MTFEGYELQIFVCVLGILASAFIALLVDYLKTTNEKLRESNAKLLARHDSLAAQASGDTKKILGVLGEQTVALKKVMDRPVQMVSVGMDYRDGRYGEGIGYREGFGRPRPYRSTGPLPPLVVREIPAPRRQAVEEVAAEADRVKIVAEEKVVAAGEAELASKAVSESEAVLKPDSSLKADSNLKADSKLQREEPLAKTSSMADPVLAPNVVRMRFAPDSHVADSHVADSHVDDNLVDGQRLEDIVIEDESLPVGLEAFALKPRAVEVADKSSISLPEELSSSSVLPERIDAWPDNSIHSSIHTVEEEAIPSATQESVVETPADEFDQFLGKLVHEFDANPDVYAVPLGEEAQLPDVEPAKIGAADESLLAEDVVGETGLAESVAQPPEVEEQQSAEPAPIEADWSALLAPEPSPAPPSFRVNKFASVALNEGPAPVVGSVFVDAPYVSPVFTKPVFSEPVFSEPVFSEPVFSQALISDDVAVESVVVEASAVEAVEHAPIENADAEQAPLRFTADSFVAETEDPDASGLTADLVSLSAIAADEGHLPEEGHAHSASASVEEMVPMLDVPTGTQEAEVLRSLLERRETLTGLVVSIGINEFGQIHENLGRNAADQLLSSVDQLMSSLAGREGFCTRHQVDEFLLIFPKLVGPAAQRSLSDLSERLWDFQLRNLGTFSVVFSWGAMEAQRESLRECMNVAQERMKETQVSRRTVSLTGGRRRRVS